MPGICRVLRVSPSAILKYIASWRERGEILNTNADGKPYTIAMCVGATKDINGLLEFTVSETGKRIGLFSIAVFPVHAKDFSDKVTLGN